MASLEHEGEARPGILELYRASLETAVEFAARYRLAIAVEIGMVGLWFLLHTFVGAGSRLLLAWTVLASLIAFVSPTSGLVILAATGPFYEPATLSRALGLRNVLVGMLGLSVGARLLAGGWRRMTWTAPVRMAVALTIVTLLGVANTWRIFPKDWAIHATQTWLATVGGALILLLVGVWVAGTGARRFVVAAVAAVTVAVALSMVELFAHGTISHSRLEWIGFWKDFGPRLGGAVPSPNGMAALAVLPACILAAVAALGRDRRLRVAAALGAAVLFVAMYVTYSRAALISLFGLAVVVSWRLNRRLGQVVFVVGLVAGILLLPKYLQIRGEVGSAGAMEPGSLLVASDRDRITGWQAAVGMFQRDPLTGQGFLAYKLLASDFGDPVLGSPHNEWLRFFAEEGVIGGIVGLCFAATTLSWLAHGRGALASGILAGTIGYFTMASFNNPLLFIQISSVVFPLIGFGLVAVWSARSPPGAVPQTGATSRDRGDRAALPDPGGAIAGSP